MSLGCRVLADQGLSDQIWGHVSTRDGEAGGVWLKRSRIGFEEVGPEDVHLIDRDGSVLDGTGNVHLEYPIHTEVLAYRDDAGAVVHAHPEAAVTFAATDLELRPIGHEGSLFARGVPRYTETSDLIRDAQMGKSVARALGDCNALFLVNHGIVTVGPDVATAVLTAIFLEKACRMQLNAAATGSSLTWTAQDEAFAKSGRVYNDSNLTAAWRYMCRRLPHRQAPAE